MSDCRVGSFSVSVEHFPEHPTAYLFDVIKDTLSRTKDFYLLVQRTGWFYPLHLDSGNQTFINMMYQQIRPDYLDGNMLVIANKTISKDLKVCFISCICHFEQCSCMFTSQAVLHVYIYKYD